MFLTIAIPSYNRPETLIELLNSIDFVADDLEVVICEDCSPRRKEISEAVKDFNTNLNVKYFENEYNLGYDENLWELVRKSSGDFIIYMGDDDEFIPNALEKFYHFLKNNQQLGYVLKSHIGEFSHGKIEYFNYYKTTCFFTKGANSIVEVFRKSVLISGFCIRRYNLLEYYTDQLKGSLLTQLFFLSIQCLKFDSAYFEFPLTVQKEKNTIPYFGSSENEKELYISGENSVKGSINFMTKFIEVMNLIDSTFQINIKSAILKDMSKYCYPTLAIQRHRGIKIFLEYASILSRLGYNLSVYFYVYTFALVLFGKKNCDSFITFLKSKLKHTPHL
jgi:glycosyltransferase involved in cell wall biosynthesis